MDCELTCRTALSPQRHCEEVKVSDEPPSTNETNGERPGRPLRILLVEDHHDTAATTALLLRMYGHEVTVATDGSAALDIVRHQIPEVVLLDLGLPKMDGYEVARRLLPLCEANRPVLIAVSGYGASDDQRRTEEAGFDMHLLKPVDPVELEAVLTRIGTTLYDGSAY